MNETGSNNIGMNEILLELKILNKIMVMSNGDKLEFELAKHATTDERKMMWALIDGSQTAEEIAKIINKTKRAVDIFLDVLENAELIAKRRYGVPPKRMIDYAPPSWRELLRSKSGATLESQEASTTNQEVEE